ncbi:MAG: hypothetical protein NTW14_00770 [bacterium]|nr:hypothetical protein [bacterium]
MTVKMCVTLICAATLGSFIFTDNSQAQMQFSEGDWVSFTDFRQVNDVEVGRDYVYFSSPGGVLRYHLYRKEWMDPWVVVRGLDRSVDLRQAVKVDYLPETDEVAVLTARGSFIYNPVSEFWKEGSHEFNETRQAVIEDAIFTEAPGSTISGQKYFKQGNHVLMDRNLHKFALGAYAGDTFGYWWIGVQGVGVLQYDTRGKRGTIWELGLFGRDSHAMTRNKDWTITAGYNRNGGITFWQPEENVWDHLQPQVTSGLESGWINDVAVTGYWALAATDAGLAQIDLRNGTCRTWTLFDGLWSNATTSVTAEKDTVWIGMEGGLCKLMLPKGPIVRVEDRALINQPIYRIALDAQAIWIGGESGLFRLDRKTDRGGYLDLSGGVGGAVYALHSTPNELWVGRMSGIEVVDKQSLKQTGYPAQAHFSDGKVNAVLAVDSLVWIGTDRGLWKFDRSRNRWHGYTNEDGLLDNRVQTLLLDGDYLLIGTPAGITRFYWNDSGRID